MNYKSIIPTSIRLIAVAIAACIGMPSLAQGLPTDGPLTIRPLLQSLGQSLLRGKHGSIVAIDPTNGALLCLATNGENGEDVSMAIAKAYAPGSTIKTAAAMVYLSEGIANGNTTMACPGYFLEKNIRVGCHRHVSPLNVTSALAVSCNTWFLNMFLSMLNDRFAFESQDEAITVWHDYITSMGLGGPLGVDIPGELGGLVPNVRYLNHRYNNKWDPLTILWAGMGQGDITVTPLQLAVLASCIANRGQYYIPHIHKPTSAQPLGQRYLQPRQAKGTPEAYRTVISGMRKAVLSGTCHALKANYPVCGKTGTIENSGSDHSAVIAFAPMDNPKIAISVYIEHGGFGANLAAPIASLIMEMYLKGQLSSTSKMKKKRIEKISTI